MRTVAATLLAGTLLAGVHTASADIGLESVSRTSGAPGDRVELLLYCGGCLPQKVRLPVYLLPAGDAPARHPCRGTSCAPRAPAPPTGAPYVRVGTAIPLEGGAALARRLGLELPQTVKRRGPSAIRAWVASANELRFEVPEVEPGLYTYVIFCCGTAQNEGSLIGHPQRQADRNRARLALALKEGQFLRVHRGAGRADESGGPPWPLWIVGAGVAAIALVALSRRRAATA